MDPLGHVRQLWSHCVWADGILFAALEGNADATTAWQEYSHILGAASVWLARLEKRISPVKVWPTLSRAEATALRRDLITGYDAYFARLDANGLAELIEYTNSAGQTFRNSAGDMLLQVMLHGQYHRGKINRLLREQGSAPVPVDYIAWIRGVPAAVGGPRR